MRHETKDCLGVVGAWVRAASLRSAAGCVHRAREVFCARALAHSVTHRAIAISPSELPNVSLLPVLIRMCLFCVAQAPVVAAEDIPPPPALRKPSRDSVKEVEEKLRAEMQVVDDQIKVGLATGAEIRTRR